MSTLPLNNLSPDMVRTFPLPNDFDMEYVIVLIDAADYVTASWNDYTNIEGFGAILIKDKSKRRSTVRDPHVGLDLCCTSREHAVAVKAAYDATQPADHSFYLSRVYLDSNGYDHTGTYFGHDAPLYVFSDATGDCIGHVRGKTRAEAKAAVLKLYPHAKFFR